MPDESHFDQNFGVGFSNGSELNDVGIFEPGEDAGFGKDFREVLGLILPLRNDLI